MNCQPEHVTGSKPNVQPVMGNNDREIAHFVVRHGADYLDLAGKVTPHPQRMTWAEHLTAVRGHEDDVRRSVTA